MKLLLLFFVLFDVNADAINLGIIDSKKQLLDQRYTMDPSEGDRVKSMRQFYLSKEVDLLNQIDKTRPDDKLLDPDIEWKKIMEGLI